MLFASSSGAIRFISQLHNQILCLHGYLFKFSGLHALILMASALTSVILSGIVDTVYNHKQLYKVCFALVATSSIILSWVCLIRLLIIGLTKCSKFFILMSGSIFLVIIKRAKVFEQGFPKKSHHDFFTSMNT